MSKDPILEPPPRTHSLNRTRFESCRVHRAADPAATRRCIPVPRDLDCRHSAQHQRGEGLLGSSWRTCATTRSRDNSQLGLTDSPPKCRENDRSRPAVRRRPVGPPIYAIMGRAACVVSVPNCYQPPPDQDELSIRAVMKQRIVLNVALAATQPAISMQPPPGQFDRMASRPRSSR
jgi:hypothetical protein